MYPMYTYLKLFSHVRDDGAIEIEYFCSRKTKIKFSNQITNFLSCEVKNEVYEKRSILLRID